MDNQLNKADNQQIDLSEVGKKISDIFESIAIALIRGLYFIRRNLVWLALVFILGAGLGWYLDRSGKAYQHSMIVMPNFGSTDYLYEKINLLNEKIKEGDTVFIRDVVGLEKPKKWGLIEVEPIPDIYRFIENREENFELIKLMAENGNINEILEDNMTAKNYTTHNITFRTGRLITEEKDVEALLAYLNKTVYFNELKKVSRVNIESKIKENDSIIGQINSLLNAFARNASSGKGGQMVYYNENTQLNDVIKTKDQLVNEQGNHRLQLIYTDQVVKKLSETINILDHSGTNNKKKFVLPLLFVVFYCGIFLLRNLFRAFAPKA